MNDPFAMFDPMGNNKPKTNGAAGYNTTAMPMNYGQPAGFPPQQQQQQHANPFGLPVGRVQQQASLYSGMMPPGNGSHPPPYPSLNNFGGAGGSGGAAFMTQPGPVASFSSLAPAPQQHQLQPMPMASNSYMQAPQQQHHFLTSHHTGSSNPFGDGGASMSAAHHEPFGAPMKAMGGGFAQTQQLVRPPEPTSVMTMPPAPLRQSSSIIVDFDPFSPRENTPRSPFDFPGTQTSSNDGSVRNLGSSSDFTDRKRQTQEAQRSQLCFSSDAFSGATGSSGSTPKISLKDIGVQQQQSRGTTNGNATRSQQSGSFDDSPFFSDNDEAFADHHMFANVDDESAGKNDWGQLTKNKKAGDADADDTVPDECSPNEYDVTFESGRKLGVLMERVDIWTKREDKRQELAVVKLVVENGAADRVGVSTGSSVVAINGHSIARDSYTVVLEMIKGVPRPMTVRFKRGTVNKDTTQGSVLTRISSASCVEHAVSMGVTVSSRCYFLVET